MAIVDFSEGWLAAYFAASDPTFLRPLGPMPLTWMIVASRTST
jgi:hypothetical protein